MSKEVRPADLMKLMSTPEGQESIIREFKNVNHVTREFNWQRCVTLTQELQKERQRYIVPANELINFVLTHYENRAGIRELNISKTDEFVDKLKALVKSIGGLS